MNFNDVLNVNNSSSKRTYCVLRKIIRLKFLNWCFSSPGMLRRFEGSLYRWNVGNREQSNGGRFGGKSFPFKRGRKTLLQHCVVLRNLYTLRLVCTFSIPFCIFPVYNTWILISTLAVVLICTDQCDSFHFLEPSPSLSVIPITTFLILNQVYLLKSFSFLTVSKLLLLLTHTPCKRGVKDKEQPPVIQT